jgi:hypothetical protein
MPVYSGNITEYQVSDSALSVSPKEFMSRQRAHPRKMRPVLVFEHCLRRVFEEVSSPVGSVRQKEKVFFGFCD